jgi:hypothetical protein
MDEICGAWVVRQRHVYGINAVSGYLQVGFMLFQVVSRT